MADRYSTSAMRRQMYVPEERPDYESYIADPENQQKAQEVALNLAMLAAGPFGELPAGLRLAKNLYSGYRGLNAAERQLMPRQDRGNAMLPEEMLQLEGPPARQALPKPQRPPMSEEELQAMEIARMVGEGGPSFSRQEAARREVRRLPSEEEMRANDIARMEGEGGIDPQHAALLRALKEQREEAMRAQDISRFENEGGGAYNYTGPRYKYGLPATQGPRETIQWGNGRGLPTLAGEGAGLPAVAGGNGGGPLAPNGYRFFSEEPLLPPPSGPRFAGQQAAGASETGGFSGFRTNVPYQGNGTSIMPMASAILNRPSGEAPQPPAASSAAPTMTPEDLFNMRTAPPIDDVESQYVTQGRTPQARPRQAPAAAPAAPTRDMTIAQLWEKYNASQSPADFVRADRAMQEGIKSGKDIGYYGQKVEGEKRGGAVQNKDAAVHKALDIIQHLLTRG